MLVCTVVEYGRVWQVKCGIGRMRVVRTTDAVWATHAFSPAHRKIPTDMSFSIVLVSTLEKRDAEII